MRSRDATAWTDLLGASTSLHQAFGYDLYGRLNSVSNGAASATYTYLSNSDRLQTTLLQSSGSAVLTTTRGWEQGERLQSISHATPTTSVGSRQYGYDPLQRRTQALWEDGSYWQYTYNDRDEVTGGKRYWADTSPVAGQQFEYAYDGLGNRTNTLVGGDASGANLRPANYTPNSLNQYTQREVPGYVNVLAACRTYPQPDFY